PSKPRFWPNPVPARWPLWPRVEVFPWPEPMPRPMRLRAFFCPAGGLKLLRFISNTPDSSARRPGQNLQEFLRVSASPREKQNFSILNLEQIRNFLHHAAENRRIRPHHNLIEFPQAKPLDYPFVLVGSADGAAHEFDFDGASH